jgi:hypothetical protein
MKSTIIHRVCCGLVIMTAVSAYAQTESAVPVPAVTGSLNSEDRMLAPPPVSGQAYPVAFSSESRANYLNAGITFSSAYSDNVLATGSNPVSDVSYSVWPTIAIDETTTRLHWVLSYAPGFTFYQRTDSRNEADHSLAFNLEYRLSPHVTASIRESFQKSSNVFNQPDQGLATGVSGSAQGDGAFLITPVADRLTNNANVGITYQFAANSMVGASGTFTNLHYPNPDQVLGELFDSASRGGSAFYSYRVSRKQYLGASYQYQDLLSYPGVGTTQTQTHAALFFYTAYLTSRVSVSAFGGPQYAETEQPGSTVSHSLTPAAGGSLSWQARHTAVAVSYTHLVNGGGGLIGAAKSDTASVSLRQQIMKNLVGSVTGSYSNNRVLVISSFPDTSGHSVAGTASLQRQFGPNFSVQLGYTRLHQVYGNIPAISTNPDTNREWVSVSYQFTKALGR